MPVERPTLLGGEYGKFDQWAYRFWKYISGDNWVDYTKFQQIPSNTLVGRYGTGTGNAQSIVIGTRLSLSTDGTLSADAQTVTGTATKLWGIYGTGTTKQDISIGSNLTLSTDGTLSAATAGVTGTATTLWGVYGTGTAKQDIAIGTGLALSTAGTLAVDPSVAGLFRHSQRTNWVENPIAIINQRGVTTVSGTNTNGFVADRWRYAILGTNTVRFGNVALSANSANGFLRNGVEIITTSGGSSVGASDYSLLFQHIEGFNVAEAGFGASGAKTVTLSFYVFSGKTGTLGGALRNGASNRSYPFSVTINAANTWERKTVTIPGDTSGTWESTTGIGMTILIAPISGSTFLGTAGAWAAANYIGATGQTQWTATNDSLYLTGFQLEIGSVATPFVLDNISDEYMRCRRFFQICTAHARGYLAGVGGYVETPIYHYPPMRATPTVTIIGSGAAANLDTGFPQANAWDQFATRWTISAAAAGDVYALGYTISAEAEL